MRRAANRDRNEAAIVAALEAAGCTVQRLSAPGVPDLLVGSRMRNYLLEVKDPAATRGRAQALKLTPDQARWHGRWKGQAVVVTCELDALAAVGLSPLRAASHP